MFDTARRTWLLPEERWILSQSWRDLLFAHWPVPSTALRKHVPPPLELEEHAGSAWVGLTPFRLKNVRPRWLPPLPALSSFAEVNLRTYVTFGDRSGVFFFSLDAASRLTVLGARRLYGLPYYLAKMRFEKTQGGLIRYRCCRKSESAEIDIDYYPVGPPFSAGEGTLEHFLLERYTLFSVTENREKVLQADIHHAPWSIQEAEATIRHNTLAQASGIRLPTTRPILHFSARQDTVVGPPKRFQIGRLPGRVRI